MVCRRSRAAMALFSSLMMMNSAQALPQKRFGSNPEAAMIPASSASVSQALKGTLISSISTGAQEGQPLVTKTASDAPAPVATYATTAIAADTSASISIEDSAPVQEAIDAFLPVATGAPPSQITTRDNHPLPRLNIVPQEEPLHTNKFYANLFLGSQRQPVFTHPYSVSWSGGNGTLSSWGLTITQIEPSQRAFGKPNENITGSPASNLVNPIFIQSLVLSAAEFSNDTTLTSDSLDGFSVNANLKPSADSISSIKFPLLQGMGFVTGIYTKLQPVIESGIFFKTVTPVESSPSGTLKYKIELEDGRQWLMYVIPSDGSTPSFDLKSQTRLEASASFSGVIQIAKNPASDEGESVIDSAAGIYPTGASLSGSVSGTSGTYTIKWTTGGDSSKKLLMYALAHHQSSFDPSTSAGKTPLVLSTTTKGNATAILANAWTMTEPNLPIDMGFGPWTPPSSANTSTIARSCIGSHIPIHPLPATGAAALALAATAELAQDMDAQSNLDSFYYAGKALSKFASIVWAAQELGNAPEVAAAGLAKLKAAFKLFLTNGNKYPLVYETSWKGVVSSAWADSGADFGNSFYNDHHFHFGYFLHAAAMVGALDPAWLEESREYINTMVRDASNPSAEDGYFPVFRSFDWYHGHSWAKGLFESGDGKDEESSSEDVMFAYALKMWGKTTGDASMEARGNLMLSVLARSLNSYFLMASDNEVQPKEIVGNKVTGILFDNKIDHVTYFGANPEFVQGIHMIPIVPASVLTRPRKFVQEEWDIYFAENAFNPASKVAGGWKGVLYSNLALIDPKASYDFFADPAFDESALDGGASKTWYLAMAAGLGGVA